MKRRFIILAMTCLMFTAFFATDAMAAQEWISDILANPTRYWNRNVTVIGDVQAVVANPPGTTRGTYTILDDSGPNPMTIQTKDLPPIGRTYQVTGVVVQDPNNANVPILREIKRSAPGMSSNMKILLIAGGALFLVLLIVFIVLLAKPKTAAPVQTARPAPRPTTSAPPPPPSPAPAPVSPDKTTKIPTAATTPSAAPSPDKTQVFISLGAEIKVDKGPDKDKEFTLHKQVTTIGRTGGRNNDVGLSDDTVSKEQASVYYDNTTKQFTLKNESQTNVTQVNGQMATDPIALNSGDLIEMGKSVLKFLKE
ncbi:FHA domain-containing protein [Acidobacteriota bacterium]